MSDIKSTSSLPSNRVETFAARKLFAKLAGVCGLLTILAASSVIVPAQSANQNNHASFWGISQYVWSFFGFSETADVPRQRPANPRIGSNAGNPSPNAPTGSAAAPCAPTLVTLNVPGSYSTIQAAINAANPSGGDKIKVAAGTYTEQLVVNKCVTIEGDGQAATIIKSPATLATSSIIGVSGIASIVEARSFSYVTMTDLTVAGPVPFDNDVFGIFVAENATLNMRRARVTAIRKTSGIDGVQRGNAVLAGDVGSNQIGFLDFGGVTIDDYQKTGIIVERAGSSALITGSTVTGAGAQTAIAQNGIQVSSGATATITDNSISGNVCNNAACSFATYYSYGVIAFGSGAISVSGNTFNNNDAGIYSYTPDATSTIDRNTLTQTRYSGFDLDQGTNNVGNNFITGGAFGPATGVGVLSYAGNTANTVANLRSNSITGAARSGIWLNDFGTSDTAFPTVASAEFNRIAGNVIGIENDTTSSAVPQTNNFWGCNQGPNGGTGCDTTEGTVNTSNPYLRLTSTTATPTAVNTGGTATVTTSLRINSAGTNTFTSPTNRLPNPIASTASSVNNPNGIPVNFSSNSFGAVSPAVAPLVDGLAQTTFTGGGVFSGNQTAVVTAAVDNAADSTNVTVNDTTPPTVSIAQAAGQADPTNVSPINFTVVFNEVVTGFTSSDISTTGSSATISGIVVTNPSNDGKTYNVAVSATSSGTVTATVVSGAAQDPAGNSSGAPTVGDNTVNFFVGSIVLAVDDDGAASATNCADSAPAYTTIQAAVAAASAGYTIRVCPGTYTTPAASSPGIGITQAGLTIVNAEATKPTVNIPFSASGTGHGFQVNAAGVTFDGLNFVKSDQVSGHNLIGVFANNFTVRNSSFDGPNWQTAAPGGGNHVSRGIEVTGGVTGLLITNNTFQNLRQPAYINGGGVGSPVVGMISNNTVTGTKGFVVAGASINFTGNTFGYTCVGATPPQNCGADIALFNNVDPAFYSNLLALSTNNDNAYISVQFPVNPSPSGRAVTFVDDSPITGVVRDGRTAAQARQTIQDAINNTLPGGTVNVAAGTYPETVIVDRPLTIRGAKFGVLAKPRNVLADESTIVVGLSTTTPVEIQADNVTFDGFNFDINQTNPTANNGGDKPQIIVRATGNPGNDGYQNLKVLNNRLPYSEAEVENVFAQNYGVWFAQSTDSLIEGNYLAGFPAYGALAESGSTNLIVRNNDAFNNNIAGFGAQGNFTRPAPQLKHNNLLIENNRFDRDEVLLFQVEGGIARGNTLIGGQLGTGRFNLGGGNNNVDIINNTIQLSRLQGVATFTYFEPSNNTIPYAPNSNIDVVGNTFTRLISPATNLPNSATTGSFAAIDYRGTGGTNTIANNTLRLFGTLPAGGNSSFGIRLRGSGSGNFAITGNSFDGGNVTATGTALPVTGLNIFSNAAGNVPADGGAFPASSTVNVNCNTFTRFQQGISVFDQVNNTFGGLSSGGGITINNNNIVGNSQFGVNNGGTSATINAQSNYWGAADGPGPVGPGSGDRVTPNVDFSNFRTAPVTGCANLPPPPPTVTINKGASQSDPTSVSPITFDVVFSEPVTGFDASDVVVSGSAFGSGATPVVNVSGSGANYTVTVSGMNRSGTVTASIPAGAATGANGANVASTSNDNTVFYNFVAGPPINTAVSVNPTNTAPAFVLGTYYAGWVFANESPSGGTGVGSFVTGPGTPPAPVGSVRLQVNDTGRYSIVTQQFGGVRFADISDLRYSTYQNNAANPNAAAAAIALQFDVDSDLSDANTAYQGRLVYEPYLNNGGTVPQGGWNEWNTLNGVFWGSTTNDPNAAPRPISVACPQSNPCTRAQLLAQFPNMGVRFLGANNPANGAFLLRAGGPVAGGFDGNADRLVVGINGNTTTFNFEPTPPNVSISDAAAVTEGNGGTATATFTVSVSQVSQLDTTVTVTTADGTATAGSDYTAKTQTVTIPAGQTSAPFTVDVTGDANVEGNETFTANLSNAVNAAIDDAQGTATINNDDVVIRFCSATYTVNEGDGTATITVCRDGVTPNSASVNYATSNGSATAGSDYTATSGTLTFASGDTIKSFTVPITDDAISESPNPETVNLTLSGVTGGATLGLASAVLNINDNDGGGFVTISGNIKQFQNPGPNTNLPGVTVTLSGSASCSTTTDQNGNYSFGAPNCTIPAGGSYQVTPSGLGKIYDPIYRNYSSLNVNVSNADFVAYNSINDVPRRVRIGFTTVAPGQQVTVPIRLESLGNENGVSFSLAYDAARLGNPVVTLGADAPAGSALIVNPGTGVIGIVVTAPIGQTFGAAGSKEIVKIQFNTVANSDPNTALTFTDSPTVRNVNDPNANPRQAQFTNGAVVFAQGFEADVDPGTSGDGDVDLGDFNEIGQYAAGLAAPDFTVSNEYQRADCEPTATKGDADIDLGDFIQAGRYAAFLDPKQSVGGPAYSNPLPPNFRTILESGRKAAIPRIVSAANVTGARGSTVTVGIQIDAEAADKGVSFTMDYDANKLGNPQVSLGSGGNNGFLVPNTNISGKVIVQLAYINGGFQAGVSQIILIKFDVAANAAAGTTPLTFNDAPVERQVRDANNIQVASTFTNGSVTISGPTSGLTTVRGRVLNSAGRSVIGATVTLTDATGTTRTARSNPRGFYRFDGVPAATTYTLNAVYRGFSGTPQVVSVTQDISEVDIVVR